MADDRQTLTTERCPELEVAGFPAQRTWTSRLKRNPKGMLLVVIAMLSVVIICLLIATAYKTNSVSGERQQPEKERNNKHASDAEFTFSVDDEAEDDDSEAGVRTDDVSEFCDESQPRQFFPDMDYAMLGYNILRGYPLADGHDPGFTLPIFRANYSQNQRTADCRYMVPKGLVVIPDISCVTSFSSTIVKTEKELSESASKFTGVHGGFLGLSFSASTTYKDTSSEISKGKSVYIISKAECNYFFSKLSKMDPPSFDPLFLQWVYKLNDAASENDEDDVYYEFLDTYGTHFFLDVTFGAKYIYQHKMKSSDYETMTQSGVDVEASANYAGLFSLGSDFREDDTRKTLATNFLKSVQTNTITEGAAPPPDGNAQTWASIVHDDPVPIHYTLAPIENLFTENYMEFLNVNFQNIFSKLNTSKMNYCQYLQDIGLVERCQESTDNIFFYMTNILTQASSAAVVGNRRECIKICQQVEDFNCNVVLWDPTMVAPKQNCFLYKDVQYTVGPSSTIDIIIVRSNIDQPVVFQDTTLIGTSTTYTGIESSGYCGEYCDANMGCVAYTYCDCSNLGICRLFTYDGIQDWKQDTTGTGSITTFVKSKGPHGKGILADNKLG